jgi:putative NADH-flavin reductase
MDKGRQLMRIAIFGASGGTGRQLVSQAVAAGHEVTAVVRNPAAFAIEKVRVSAGDVTDPVAVASALEGQDAILSTLGAASPFEPYPAFQQGIRNILGGMQTSGARRFIYLSFVGVPESRSQFGFIGQHVIAPRILRYATEGHRLNEEAIKASPLDWTIVRAPKLTDGPRTSSYRVGEYLKPRGLVPTLARADVAELMLQQLGDTKYVRRCLTVMR